MIEQPALLILIMKDNELPHSLQLYFCNRILFASFYSISLPLCQQREGECEDLPK
jgi:hypothetical protein